MKHRISLMQVFFTMLFIFGVFMQLLVISPSGNPNKFGDVLFWSSHAHDSMWHIAVSNEIQKGFPLQNPIFAGEKLINYHIFSDILPAIINKVIKLPNLFIYFWLMPIVYSISLGISAYLVGKEIGKNSSAGLFSVFAVYFIGSFGYIVTLLKGDGISGESIFWGSQIQSSIGNPPQIISNIFYLLFIYFLARYLNDTFKSKITLILLLVLIALSKIYAGLVIFPSILALSIYQLVKSKKTDLFLISVTSVIVTFLLYLPFMSKASGFLIFEPFWFARKLLSDPARIGIQNFDSILQHYQSIDTVKSKIGFFLRYELFGLFLIFVGNLGIRFLGLLTVPKLYRDRVEISIFMLSSIIFSYIIPNLLLQKGVATNTSQTFQYMILITGIYFAVWISETLKNIKKNLYKTIFVLFIIILSIPTQIGLLYQFYSRPAFTKISHSEIEGLNYIKDNSNPNVVILTPPYDKYLDTKEPIPPIWDWFDTSYVSALSERRLYFTDYEQVDIMGYDYTERRDNQYNIFKNINSADTYQIVKNNNINLIYIPKKQVLVIPPEEYYERIYENEELDIYKVKY